MAAPTPAPLGSVTTITATTFAVTLSRVSGEANTTVRVQTRTAGSGDAWTTGASDATPAVGDVLTVTGLTVGSLLEWRVIEENAGGEQADGNHGRVTPAVAPAEVAAVLDETELVIENLLLGGASASEVFQGRRPKPGPQAKKISVNVYMGDPDTTSRPSTTGHSYLGLPVHIHLILKRMDKVTGESQTKLVAQYMLQILDAFRVLRPSDLSTAIPHFFLTKAQIEDIDTETGSSASEAQGVDQTVEGFATVTWEFWRPS